jgi:hypothetical protein
MTGREFDTVPLAISVPGYLTVPLSAGPCEDAFELPRGILCAPPPMIGPLAHMITDKVEEPAGVKAEIVPQLAEAKAQEPKALSIEEVATIAAAIDEGRSSEADVLAAHDLYKEAWEANKARVRDAITKELYRGKMRLQGTYDAAYVAAVERSRGPLTLAHFARVSAEVERGNGAGALFELGIQREALLPIVRDWNRRLVEDQRLVPALDAALRAAREA